MVKDTDDKAVRGMKHFLSVELWSGKLSTSQLAGPTAYYMCTNILARSSRRALMLLQLWDAEGTKESGGGGGGGAWSVERGAWSVERGAWSVESFAASE